MKPFVLKPRIKHVNSHPYIGFFEDPVRQAWIRMDLGAAESGGWWDACADCLVFHARTVGSIPENPELAKDLRTFYEKNIKMFFPAGRPAHLIREKDSA